MESGSWERVLELASSYGYAFLFLVSVAENTFLLGLVIPGDAAVVLGGALSARATLEPVTLSIVVVTGVLLGANLSFWIGRRGGAPLLQRSAERFAIDASRFRQVEAYFARHGAKTVFLASFVSGLKNLVPAIAGASKMSTTKFVTYNAGGSLIRSVLLVVVGYVFGASFPKAIEIIGSLNEWLLGAVLLTVVVLVVLGRRKRGRVRGSGEKARDRVDRGAS